MGRAARSHLKGTFMIKKKDLAKILGQLEAQGWAVRLSASSHWICRAPDGVSTVVNGSTPNDYRGFRNFKSALRRCGAVID